MRRRSLSLRESGTIDYDRSCPGQQVEENFALSQPCRSRLPDSRSRALLGQDSQSSNHDRSNPSCPVRTPPPSSAQAAGNRRRTLDILIQKQFISEADYEAKLVELEIAPAAVGPEDRLRKLEGLLKRGLSSQPEYQKKRDEILAEI